MDIYYPDGWITISIHTLHTRVTVGDFKAAHNAFISIHTLHTEGDHPTGGFQFD